MHVYCYKATKWSLLQGYCYTAISISLAKGLSSHHLQPFRIQLFLSTLLCPYYVRAICTQCGPCNHFPQLASWGKAKFCARLDPTVLGSLFPNQNQPTPAYTLHIPTPTSFLLDFLFRIRFSFMGIWLDDSYLALYS